MPSRCSSSAASASCKPSSSGCGWSCPPSPSAMPALPHLRQWLLRFWLRSRVATESPKPSLSSCCLSRLRNRSVLHLRLLCFAGRCLSLITVRTLARHGASTRAEIATWSHLPAATASVTQPGTAEQSAQQAQASATAPFCHHVIAAAAFWSGRHHSATAERR